MSNMSIFTASSTICFSQIEASENEAASSEITEHQQHQTSQHISSSQQLSIVQSLLDTWYFTDWASKPEARKHAIMHIHNIETDKETLNSESCICCISHEYQCWIYKTDVEIPHTEDECSRCKFDNQKCKIVVFILVNRLMTVADWSLNIKEWRWDSWVRDIYSKAKEIW